MKRLLSALSILVLLSVFSGCKQAEDLKNDAAQSADNLKNGVIEAKESVDNTVQGAKDAVETVQNTVDKATETADKVKDAADGVSEMFE